MCLFLLWSLNHTGSVKINTSILFIYLYILVSNTTYVTYFTIGNTLTASCSCDEKIESIRESICSGSDC